jgi:hypothetical protein
MYEVALAEQDRRNNRDAGLAGQREALVGQLRGVEDERLAFLRQNARNLLSDAELDVLLSEVDGRRGAIAEELRRAEDAAERKQEREAVHGALAALYDPVHAEWYEDPDAVQPGQFLSLAAGPEYVRRAYIAAGVRFSVDRHGTLTLEFDPLQTDGTHTATSSGSSMRTV